MEDTKGFLFSSQLEGQFQQTICFCEIVFPYLTRGCALTCGGICQDHFVKVCKVLGKDKN